MDDATRRSYDRVSHVYAQRFRDELEAKPLDTAFLQDYAARLGDGATVVDMGCGPGHITAHLCGLGLRAVGIDLSPGMIHVARRLSPALPMVVASMLDLPLAGSALDGIVAMYSVIHLDDADVPRAFTEFRRALRVGGLLLVSFHVGVEVVHLTDFLGEEVELDFHLRPSSAMHRWLADAGFAIDVALERAPYGEVEASTRRGYLIARSLP